MQPSNRDSASTYYYLTYFITRVLMCHTVFRAEVSKVAYTTLTSSKALFTFSIWLITSFTLTSVAHGPLQVTTEPYITRVLEILPPESCHWTNIVIASDCSLSSIHLKVLMKWLLCHTLFKYWILQSSMTTFRPRGLLIRTINVLTLIVVIQSPLGPKIVTAVCLQAINRDKIINTTK